jgi:hypothetical protein
MLSLIVCIVGGIVYLVATRLSATDVAELGRLSFWVGLLAYLIR